MKLFKSHFWYTKSQRNGIFLLLLLILIVQVLIFFLNDNSEILVDQTQDTIKEYQNQLDSLRLLAIESRKPKTFPFNPNYISDYKGEQLGMSLNEIERLHAFRKVNKYVNTISEFQQVTGVSDSLLAVISPYFKFPAWVDSKKEQQQIVNKRQTIKPSSIKRTTNHLNKATAQDFQTIRGVGETLSNRIVKYRDRLHGFSDKKQLFEIWGLKNEVVDAILVEFVLVEIPTIKKLNVNTATFKELLKNPYIDYNLCKKILNYRDEVAELQSILELKNIDGFPLDKYDRIILYLDAK